LFVGSVAGVRELVRALKRHSEEVPDLLPRGEGVGLSDLPDRRRGHATNERLELDDLGPDDAEAPEPFSRVVDVKDHGQQIAEAEPDRLFRTLFVMVEISHAGTL